MRNMTQNTMNNTRTIEALVSRLKGTRKDAYQYLEVKQLAEILARHRARARAAVREYRLLKQTLEAETDQIEKLYLGYEGMFVRDHLRDALRLYLMINRDFHEAYRSYMKDAKEAANQIPAILLDMPAWTSPLAANGKQAGKTGRKAA